jgi:hypothetical protein
MQILRAIWAVAAATLYKLAFAPLAVAGLFIVPLVIWRSRWHTSPLTGEQILSVPSGPLFLWANAQDGIDPPWYREHRKNWPRWWRLYEWTAIRNKCRNLPFLKGMGWLHRPPGPVVVREFDAFGVRFRCRQSGWMAELEYFYGKRFGDFGVRLDHADKFGLCSWAFRPFGRL